MVWISFFQAFQQIEITCGEFHAKHFWIFIQFAELLDPHIYPGKKRNRIHNHIVTGLVNDGIVVMLNFREGKLVVERRDRRKAVIA